MKRPKSYLDRAGAPKWSNEWEKYVDYLENELNRIRIAGNKLIDDISCMANSIKKDCDKLSEDLDAERKSVNELSLHCQTLEAERDNLRKALSDIRKLCETSRKEKRYIANEVDEIAKQALEDS
jgi:UDP-N-acetylglucosamine 2-epimerase